MGWWGAWGGGGGGGKTRQTDRGCAAPTSSAASPSQPRPGCPLALPSVGCSRTRRRQPGQRRAPSTPSATPAKRLAAPPPPTSLRMRSAPTPTVLHMRSAAAGPPPPPTHTHSPHTHPSFRMRSGSPPNTKCGVGRIWTRISALRSFSALPALSTNGTPPQLRSARGWGWVGKGGLLRCVCVCACVQGGGGLGRYDLQRFRPAKQRGRQHFVKC